MVKKPQTKQKLGCSLEYNKVENKVQRNNPYDRILLLRYKTKSKSNVEWVENAIVFQYLCPELNVLTNFKRLVWDKKTSRANENKDSSE